MAKFIWKDPKEASQKKKIIDLHKYAKSRNRFFRISLFLNIILLGCLMAMCHRM